MKNLKAAIMIILGSFFIATGFAFAGESPFGQLKGDPFASSRGASINLKATLTSPSLAPLAPLPAAPEASVTEKKKGEGFKKFKGMVGKAKPFIGLAAFGFVIGLAIIGTATGGLAIGGALIAAQLIGLI
jgi:hypothetical protein